MTSYQKLKEKLRKSHKNYEELFDKLIEVLDNPDSEKTKEIRQWAVLNRRFKMYSMLSLLEALSVQPDSNQVYSWDVLERESVKYDTDDHMPPL